MPGYFMMYEQIDKGPVLKPGQTISQTVFLVFATEDGRKKVTLRFSFVPSGFGN